MKSKEFICKRFPNGLWNHLRKSLKAKFLKWAKVARNALMKGVAWLSVGGTQ